MMILLKMETACEDWQYDPSTIRIQLQAKEGLSCANSFQPKHVVVW